MAQQFYSINVRDSQFPLLAEQQPRTVISNRGASTVQGTAEQDKIGIQYAHNVMPTKEGLESVGFREVIVPSTELNPGEEFEDTRIIYAEDTRVDPDPNNQGARLTIAWDSEGLVYILLDPFGQWVQVATSPPVSPTFTTDDVTIGTINGISYIYYKNQGCYIFNLAVLDIQQVTLTGLAEDEVLGVVASSGYLLAVTNRAIAWSSTILPTDFVPSTVTGAGGGNVDGIRGNILFAVSNTLGILVYTFANVIAATYTGNATFPFKFRPVADAKGGVNLDRVAYEPDTGNVFVYSKAGLQAVTSSKADVILPEVTDFLGGGRFDDYDTVTNTFITSIVPQGTRVRKKIKFISSRYLIISYGIDSFGFALVYDLALSRLGKIKHDHVDAFEYIGGANQDEVSKESIAFLHADGSVAVLDFSVDFVDSEGVLILAKLQSTYTRMFTLLGVETENVAESADFTCGTRVSLDGKNGTYILGTELEANENIREHSFRITGKNHAITYEGRFNIATSLVRYMLNGRR